jgi:hypothetical protein
MLGHICDYAWRPFLDWSEIASCLDLCSDRQRQTQQDLHWRSLADAVQLHLKQTMSRPLKKSARDVLGVAGIVNRRQGIRKPASFSLSSHKRAAAVSS